MFSAVLTARETFARIGRITTAPGPSGVTSPGGPGVGLL